MGIRELSRCADRNCSCSPAIVNEPVRSGVDVLVARLNRDAAWSAVGDLGSIGAGRALSLAGPWWPDHPRGGAAAGPAQATEGVSFADALDQWRRSIAVPCGICKITKFHKKLLDVQNQRVTVCGSYLQNGARNGPCRICQSQHSGSGPHRPA